MLFARQDLHATAGQIGLMLAITTVGAVLDGLAASGFLGGWLGMRPVWAIAGIGFLAVLALNSAALRALTRPTHSHEIPA